MVIRVFSRRTSATPVDNMAFVGNPPMIRPEAEEVHISCTFTWDIEYSKYLADAWGQYYPAVKLGGVAFNDKANGFVPGMYVKQGITFTSRGCNNQCPWCLVWKREGKLRGLPIVEGNKIQDNNLLQCSPQHIEKVFQMLKGQREIDLIGGLDSRLITDDIAEQIRSLRIKQIFLAADTKESINQLRTAIKKLQMPRDKIRCYALLKFNPNETISEATERMLQIWEAGAMPFPQLYQPENRIEYPVEWKRFQRTWCRPAATKVWIKLNSTGFMGDLVKGELL